MKLALVRHGQTEENAAGLVQGWRPGVLSELGMRQARELGPAVQALDPEAVYTSDLARARQTAALLLEWLPRLAAPIADVRLRERCFGIHEGRPVTRMYRQMLRQGQTWETFDPEGGEPAALFRERVLHFLVDIRHRHGGEKVVLVTHHGVVAVCMRVLNAVASGAVHPRIEYCAMTVVDEKGA